MRIGTILLTVMVAVGGFFGFRAMQSAATEPVVAEQREPVIAVAVAAASRGVHQPVVSLIGTVEAKDEALMTSPLETEILSVPVEEGDSVARGATLVRLDLRETNFQLEAQLATLDEIDAQIAANARDRITERSRLVELERLSELARGELDRNKKLLSQGLIAQSVVDQSQSAVSSRSLEIIGQRQRLNALDLARRQQDAALRRTRAQIGQLRVVLERGALVAPFAGIVKQVQATAGTRAGRGEPLVELYDPTTIRLRAAIPNSHAANPDLSGVLVSVSGRQPIEIQYIAPEAKAGRGTVDALFSLPPGSWLLGTAVEFELLLPPVPASVALPFDALYAGSRVYVVDGDTRAEPIECAPRGQTLIAGETLALLDCPDLAEGDRVVVTRVPNLVSGTKLEIVEG